MQCHAIVLDTTDTAYTFYEREKTKERADDISMVCATYHSGRQYKEQFRLQYQDKAVVTFPPRAVPCTPLPLSLCTVDQSKSTCKTSTSISRLSIASGSKHRRSPTLPSEGIFLITRSTGTSGASAAADYGSACIPVVIETYCFTPLGTTAVASCRNGNSTLSAGRLCILTALRRPCVAVL